MSVRGKWGRRLGALAALACATTVGAFAAAPVNDGWTADPDAQFLLDVKLHRYRLGDGVRAYQTPEGTCIVFGDFLTTLDVPMKIDLTQHKASGWAFKESNRITVDQAAGTAQYGGKTEAFAKGTIRETPEGWCVDTAALTKWFGISVKPVTSGSVLILQTDQKLPVELAIEREERAKSIKPAKLDLSGLPKVKLPYRMWRAPALDFVVSGGITYLAGSGARVDRQTTVYAAGEVAHLSYDAHLTTTPKGMPGQLRVRAYRSDPDGELLGPLKATHIGVGDVAGLDDRLTGNAEAGRGAVITNRPLTSPTAFDHTRLEGDLPTGWEAELYRNEQLIAFAKSDGNQRYVFDDVPLLYGDNELKVVLYGPQGQVRSHVETVNVGQQNVPPGKTWYWAGFNQPGLDLVNFQSQPQRIDQPKYQAAISMEHGLDDRTSVGVMARTMLLQDQHVTFVEGSVRRSVGPALIEVTGAKESGGGLAARAQLIGKFGSINVNAQALIANDFHFDGEDLASSRREFEVAVDAPIKIGHATIPAHTDVHLTRLVDGSSQLQAAAGLSAQVNRFNLAAAIKYQRSQLAHGPDPPGQILADFIGSGRIGQVRLRGATEFELSRGSRLRTAELDAYWSSSDNVDWETDLAYDTLEKRARARVSHINRFSTMALALTGEAATDGSFAVGFNLNFSLDAGHRFDMSREPLAAAGAVHARVFQDLNGNGVFDAGEKAEPGALVTTGTRLADQKTDSNGAVTVGGLTAFNPIGVGVDMSSLADPMLTPQKAVQVVVPRPGVVAEVDIPLVGAGDVEGALVKSGGVGFEGVDLELVDSTGKVVASERSDYDGFFLFDRVAYGSYTLQLSEASAKAIHADRSLGISLKVTPDRSVIRLGTIQIGAPTKIASAQ